MQGTSEQATEMAPFGQSAAHALLAADTNREREIERERHAKGAG